MICHVVGLKFVPSMTEQDIIHHFETEVLPIAAITRDMHAINGIASSRKPAYRAPLSLMRLSKCSPTAGRAASAHARAGALA